MQVGKYQLVSKLATGGMAEVFLAKAAGPRGFEKTLVVKRILPHLAEDPAFVDMFLAEATLVAQLNHPNIVQIFDFGEVDGTYYLAMEYIDGPNLRVLAKRVRMGGEQLPLALCAKLVSAACEGLAFAHAFCNPETGEPLGLIHRDISSDNILVSRQGAVKVVDFGVAKAAGHGQRTQTGVLKGKVSYMSPEQFQGNSDALDLRVDVYALGVVLYELICGFKPFNADSEMSMMQAIMRQPPVPVAERRPDVPVALQRILDRALAKSRNQRYPDCHALQADLERFIMSTGEPMGAYQLSQFVARYLGEGGNPVPTPTPGSGARSRPGQTPPRRNTGSVPAGGETRAGRLPAGEAVAEAGPRQQSRGRIVAPTLQEPEEDFASRRTELEQGSITEESMVGEGPARGGGRPRWLVPALAGGALLVVGGLVAFALGSGSGGGAEPGAGAPSAPGTPEVVGKAPPEREAVTVVVPVERPVAPPEEREPTGKGTEVAAGDAAREEAEPEPQPEPQPERAEEAKVPTEVEAEAKAPTVAPSKRPRPVVRRTAEAGSGTIEFRIRPYATVFLDGKNIGQTPFAPVQVSQGRHTIKLVNRDLPKEVTRTLEVKAGKTVIFKYNLLED
jgi:serine/threonine-protein kinase